MEHLWFLLGKYLLECSNKCTLCFFVWLIISLFLIKLVKDNLYCLPRKEQLLLKSIYSTFTLTTIRENKDSLVIHWINKGNYFSENDDILRIIRFGTEFQLGHLLNELANESEGKQTTPGDLPSECLPVELFSDSTGFNSSCSSGICYCVLYCITFFPCSFPFICIKTDSSRLFHLKSWKGWELALSPSTAIFLIKSLRAKWTCKVMNEGVKKRSQIP